MDKDNLFKIVEEKFSEIKNDNKPKKINSEWTTGFIGEDRDLEQTQLVFGVEGLKNIDIDRFSLRALSIILGGGMSSRLFQEIREKRGLCYSIFSFTQMQNSSGVFGFLTLKSEVSVFKSAISTIHDFSLSNLVFCSRINSAISLSFKGLVLPRFLPGSS